MLESAVARFLNHYLGKYILDFDTDNLNVGVFSGDIRLTDLILKPEALFELDLPIAVKYGKIESIVITIPWSFLRSRPVVITVQGVWLVAEPCTQNGDSVRERRLIRAARMNALADPSECISGKFVTTLLYNLQISLSDVHVRYEDNRSQAACGLCLQSLQINTTDKKWKPLNGQTCSTTNAFQVLKLESLSAYWDSKWNGGNKTHDSYSYRNELARGLQTFSIYGRTLDFVLKPIILKMKITIRTNEDLRHVQVDASLGDCVMQASRAQLRSMQEAHNLLVRTQLARRWIIFRPHVPVAISSAPWWRYACAAVLEQRVRPYQWSRILKTRRAYRAYRDIYMQTLSGTAETELKLDLLKCEDELTLTNILLAREEGKILFQQQSLPNGQPMLTPRSSSKELLQSIESTNYRFKMNLAVGNGSASLWNDEQEVFCVHISQLAICAEHGAASLRLHTLLVEGISYEDHLAPVISSTGYDSTTPIFTIEIKRNLYDGEYGIKCTLDSLEFVYNAFLVTELFKFLDYYQLECIWNCCLSLLQCSLPTGMRVDISIKNPRCLIPESGCIQKGGGSMLVIAPGIIHAVREGTPDPDLEAGLAELEERLYTRWNVSFADAQILLADGGDAWREALESLESNLHCLHRCSGEVTMLYSICPNDTRLPLQKYNISLNSFRLSLSNNKMSMLLDVFGNIPIPKPLKVRPNDFYQSWPLDVMIPQSEIREVQRLKRSISYISESSIVPPSLSAIDKSSSSDASDLGEEAWARTVDLPGFEDNVSPSNPITFLIRCVVLESCLAIIRTDGRNERPFLQLRLGKICVDGALMAYGPALQFSLESLLLTDQLHTGPAGQYLEMAASGPGQDIISILYRRVRADCPDFRSHFRSVESSFVVDVGHLRLRWRSDACRGVMRHLRRMGDRVRTSKALRRLCSIWRRFKPTTVDPPIPPGAVKFSRSVRVASTRVTLADLQTDLIELHICGFEYDCTFRANEKLQLRLYLNALTIEDLSNLTLYPKIVSMEEDFVLEMKYVGHTSHILQTAKQAENLPCDGNLRLQLGRMHVAPLGAKGIDRLLRPVPVLSFIQSRLHKLMNFLLQNKLLISFQIGGPTLLIPQKLDSPNVIIIHKGDISVENFFSQTSNGIVDNILIRVDGTSISRAVMTLAGSLQIQGNLLDPLSIRLDVKHNMSGCDPVWNISGSTELLRITLGQCDLSTIIGLCAEHIPKTRVVSDCEGRDHRMSELQAFLSQTVRQVLITRFTFDGVHVELITDCDEVLSSPVRDLNRSLCKLNGTEFNIGLIFHSDTSWKINACLRDLKFLDVRTELCEKFDTVPMTETIFSVDLLQSCSKDVNINIALNDLHLQWSTMLITQLHQFVLECLPGEWPLEGGLENQGYEKESATVDSPEFNIKLDITAFRFSVLSEDLSSRLFLSADLHFLYTLESYLDIENIYVQLETQQDNEWIIEPFNIKIIHTLSQISTKISAIVTEMKIIINPKIVHNCMRLLSEIQLNSMPDELDETYPNEHDITEDMWLPKKLPQHVFTSSKCSSAQSIHFFGENIIFVAPTISIICTLDEDYQRLPLLLCKLTCDMELRGHCTLKLTVQSNYYNQENNMWEPLVEPIGEEFRPYEVNISIFRTAALPVTSRTVQSDDTYSNRVASSTVPTNVSDTSADSDSDAGETMSFMRPPPERVHVSPSPPLGEHESDLEDDALERLTSGLAYLFTSDSSDDQDTDSNTSSDTEQSIHSNSDNVECVVHDEEVEHLTNVQELATYVVIDSRDVLNVTVTPESMDVLTKLTQALTTEYSPHSTRQQSNTLLNNLGSESTIELLDTDGMVICSTKPTGEVESPASSASSSPVQCAARKQSTLDVDGVLRFHKPATSEIYLQVTQFRLRIKVPSLADLSINTPTRSCRKVVRLHPPLHGTVYYVTVETTIAGSLRTISTRSPLQVRNETSYVLGLFYQGETLKELGITLQGEPVNPFESRLRLVMLQPHETYDVPLFIAYHCKLFIQPAHLDSDISTDGLWWVDIANPHIESCKIKQNDNKFYVGVSSRTENSLWKDVSQAVPCRTLYLLPPLTIYNCLPRDLRVLVPGATQFVSIEPSAQVSVHESNPVLEFKIDFEFEYYGYLWTGSTTVGKDVAHRTIVMNNVDCCTERLTLLTRVDWAGKAAACRLYIHSPYWIVNRTGLDLQLRGCGSDAASSVRGDVPALWTWPRGGRRRCIRLRIAQASWSPAFPLDTLGCTGRVVCRDRARGKRYRLLLSVNQAQATPLTTLVVLHPLFLVTNHTDMRLRFMEENENADLWFDLSPGECLPYWPETDSMHMYVKYEDGRAISQRFPITRQHHTVLRMERCLPAMCVSVTGGDTTSFTVAFCPYHPGDSPVLLINRCTDLFLKFNQRGLGQTALLSPDHSLLYTWDDPSADRHLIWNVYNNKGRGFELVFNEDGEDEHTVEDCRGGRVYITWVSFMEGSQRIVLFTQNKKTLSTYRNLERAQTEVYLSLKGAGISICTKRAAELAYVSISDRPAKWEVNVSRKYKELSADLSTWIEDQYQMNQQKCQLKESLEMDLGRMLLLKPFFGDLRRTYSPGIWMQYRQGPSKQYMQITVQNAQIDNQLAGCTWPTILQFTDKAQPCLEVIYLWSQNNRIVHGCSIHLRDSSVLLDKGFVRSALELLKKYMPYQSQADRARTDLRVLYSPMGQRDRNTWRIHQISFAPFNVTISAWQAAEFLKKICDVSRIQHKPVIFRFASFEMKGICKSINKASERIYSHYACKVMQQLYAFILGQAVLLNPPEHLNERTFMEVGVVGAIGLAEAARRLLGHIRGAEPPHTVTLFPPAGWSFRSSRLSSDMTEATLVIAGLCGSFATADHVLRNTCRSLLGFMSRETVDCTAIVMEAIQRSQPNMLMRIRLPRVCDVMRLEPFCTRRAVGNCLLHSVATHADVYWAHASVDCTARRVLLISFTNVYVVRKKQIWGSWETEWHAPLDSIVAIPVIEDNALVFSLTEEEANKIGVDNYKVSGTLSTLNWLKNKIEEAMIIRIEDEQWCG